MGVGDTESARKRGVVSVGAEKVSESGESFGVANGVGGETRVIFERFFAS